MMTRIFDLSSYNSAETINRTTKWIRNWDDAGSRYNPNCELLATMHNRMMLPGHELVINLVCYSWPLALMCRTSLGQMQRECYTGNGDYDKSSLVNLDSLDQKWQQLGGDPCIEDRQHCTNWYGHCPRSNNLAHCLCSDAVESPGKADAHHGTNECVGCWDGQAKLRCHKDHWGSCEFCCKPPCRSELSDLLADGCYDSVSPYHEPRDDPEPTPGKNVSGDDNLSAACSTMKYG